MNPPDEGRRELDSVVINIELTLVSIIQGVALFFLTDNARVLISLWHWEAFLYVVAALCVIFIFWSRSVIHTLTLIGWPLEFGHNFFYIGFAIWRWPDLFIARAGHSWLISTQLLSFIGYLFYTSRYFSAIAPLVLRSRQTN